ncbi:MAG: UDP-2,3-diacylglucosamine diphosphatase [Gammaproteobacteria bacterium]|nr:UDP-2,3-diacylglucosamine diphosphatase [Gammaproteobacteria bacterium]
MNKISIFLSDIHLSEQSPQITKNFEKFYQYCLDNSSQIECIYILGDLFEFWIGDDFLTEFNQSIFDKLKDLSEITSETYFMQGNRDFLTGHHFEKMSGFNIIHDPHIITINKQQILLSHGDILCIDDVAYQTFRNHVRNKLWQNDFLTKTINERIQIALNARKESIKNHTEKEEYIMDVNEDEVKKILTDNKADILIHGHTHRPKIHSYTFGDKTTCRYVLPAWYKQAGFLIYIHEKKIYKYINI